MKLSDNDLDNRYREMLDEVYGMVKIGPYEYATSEALKDVDTTAYRCGFNDWLDSELGETILEKDGEYFDNKECEE